MALSGTVITILALSVLLNAILLALFLVRRNKIQKRSAEEEDEVADTWEPEVPLPQDKLRYEVQTFTHPAPGILKGLTVLVADDNEVNIDVLSGMLEVMGLERLVIARNGKEAVEAVNEHKIDVAFMDIQMPEMNGIDASKKILNKPAYSDLPIIPITGFSRIVNADMCKEAGMVGFLQKPVELEKLRTATKKALKEKHVRTVA